MFIEEIMNLGLFESNVSESFIAELLTDYGSCDTDPNYGTTFNDFYKLEEPRDLGTLIMYLSMASDQIIRKTSRLNNSLRIVKFELIDVSIDETKVRVSFSLTNAQGRCFFNTLPIKI
jgi:hypothetical protein